MSAGPKLFRLLSIALYVPCLALGGIESNGQSDVGFFYLGFGMFGIFASVTNLSWLANPALFVAWIFLFREERKLGLAGASIAPIFAALPLFMTEIVTNEGGVATAIDGYDAGYWLWLASTMMMLIAYVWFAISERKHRDP